MSKELINTFQLTKEEILEYLSWAQNLQELNAESSDSPINGLYITFELTSFGTSVVAHTGISSYDNLKVLRD